MIPLVFYRSLQDEANGTFLVREMVDDQHEGKIFILSFVIEKIVYHVQMVVENERLELGGKLTSMETIYDMVEYFRRVPIYSEVTLLDRPKWKPTTTNFPPINICEK